jgi:hypothetical protein
MAAATGYAQDKPDSQPFAKKVDQLGSVVPDLEAAIEWWLLRGVGPWYTLGPALLEHNEYLGKASSPGVVIALAQMGGVQIELIQPVDKRPSAYLDFLNAGNHGLQHCGFFADAAQYDNAVAQALASGAMMQETASFAGSRFAYLSMQRIESPMDRVDLGDATPAKVAALREWIQKSTVPVCDIGEMIEHGEATQETFAKVSEAAATWDGKTDPVRNILNPAEQAGLETYELGKRIGRWFKER